MSFDESRKRELESALRSKMTEQKSIADSFRIEEGTVIVSPEQKSAFDTNMKDIREIKSLLEGFKSMDEIESWSNTPSAESVAAAAAAGARGGYGAKSLGEVFMDSPEFKALAGGRNGANMPSPFQLNRGNLGAMGSKSVYGALPTAATQAGQAPRAAGEFFGATERDAMVIPPMRTRRVRDLFPARTTTAAVIEYFRMTGFVQNNQASAAYTGASMFLNQGNASTVPEWDAAIGDAMKFGYKPQSSFNFTGQQAPVRTIAHWEAAHRNVLADEPQLRSIIDNELLYGLRLQEDYQILRGDGVGENLLGVLNTSGIQNYSWSSGQGASTSKVDTRADALRRAATLSLLAYYEPTGVVLHPTDWENIELTKDANGQYLIAVSVALGGEPRIWRMPVVDTPAIPQGTALVGAFGTGAQIYDREESSIRISEQHSDFFVRNAIVILAEQRLALAVKRPESFVKVNFDKAPGT